MPKTAEFIEPFSGTTLAAGWTYAFGSGGVAISGGQATFTTSTTYANLIRSDTWDLTASYMAWNISTVGQQVGNDLTVGLSRTTSDNGAGLGWTVAHTSTTQIYAVARYRTTDGTTHLVQLEGNLPIATKWFRVRESGGTWFWDHSTDGTTWTNYTLRAAPYSATAVRPYFLWGRWDTAAGRVNTSYVVPGVNDLPVTAGPKVSTLATDFSTNANLFTGITTDTAITGGQLQLRYRLSYLQVVSAATYDLTESQVYIQATHSSAHASNEFFFAFGDAANGVDSLLFIISSNTLIMRERAGAESTDATVPYNATNHAWLRLRHSGTTVYWETAATSAGPWTVQRQKAQGAGLTNNYVRFYAGNYTADQASIATVDNVNTAAAPGSSLTATASASVGLDGPVIIRSAVVTGNASASAQISGRAEYNRALTATASAAPAVAVSIQRRGTMTATALASGSWVGGASGVVTPTATASWTIATTQLTGRGAPSATAAATPVIVGQNVWFRAISSRADATPVVSGVVIRSGILTANGRANPVIGLVTFVLALKAKTSIAVNGAAAFAPMKKRISTVQVVADLEGDPRGVTGMQATASVAVTGNTSLIRLGPVSRFIVQVSATGRFSVITELTEVVTVEVHSQGDLRVVQSLTTIFEEGVPALLTPPEDSLVPASEPAPDPEPEPIAPTFTRVFYGMRR